MTHQVLARKWRPRDFASLVGQEHVVRALTHALDSGRLHHAYLFTGTRGVGKTTIARILAKSLNCETGVTARPCGQCAACRAIDEGRFPDHLELDAASNRGVDEMVQLLDNAVYAPVSGRYKVYVIDEVHMLSTHAFNAMLKTLEEPPPHVTFILATTDPQKVPVTVLSRCLQFNLKNMPPAAVAGHLARVLQAEDVDAEPQALALLGRAAAGSMRDALSLLDQAIAFGGGRVGEDAVREMLGVVDRRHLSTILDALVAGDGPALIGVADDMLSGNAPFGQTLSDLAAFVQRIALAQVGAFGDADEDELAALHRFASAISPEDLQVWYQIAIHGARDLPLAPDEHAGFTMTLLRLLAFRPRTDGEGGALAAGAGSMTGAKPSAGAAASGARAAAGSAGSRTAAAGTAPAAKPVAPTRGAVSARAVGPTAGRAAPLDDDAPTDSGSPADRPSTAPGSPLGLADREPPARSMAALPDASPGASGPSDFDGDWPSLAARVGLGGLAQQFMQQSQLVGREGLAFRVRVPIRPLAEAGLVAKVRDALSDILGAPVRLSVEVGSVDGRTAASDASARQAERLDQARASLEADPFVRTLLTDFDGRIVPDSVKPIDP